MFESVGWEGGYRKNNKEASKINRRHGKEMTSNCLVFLLIIHNLIGLY